MLAVTFDDGPDPRGTPAVLDALAAAGLTATFFVLGEQVERHPEVVEYSTAGTTSRSTVTAIRGIRTCRELRSRTTSTAH